MKHFSLSLACALVCCFAANAQTILSLSDGTVVEGTVDTTPRCTVKKVTFGVQVTYEFDYVLVDSMQYDGRTVYKYSFPDFTDVEIPGKPVVPQHTDVLAVASLDYTLRVDVTDGLTLNGELYPSAEPLMVDESPSNLTYIPVAAYSGFYPENNAEEVSTEAASANNLCYVLVSPVRYDMSQQTTAIASRITYSIAYNDPRIAQHASRFPPKVSDIIHNITLNATSTNALSENYIPGLGSLSDEYLIVTTEKFRQPAEELAYNRPR